MKNTIINPPSTFPPYLHFHSRSLAVSHPRFLPPSLPPALATSVRPTFYSPSPLPCLTSSLPPSIPPLLPPSLPPSILPLSFPAPRCPPASYRATQYTPCVYTVLVSCTGYCVGRAQPGGVTQPGVALRQWRDRAISRWLAVTLATHPTTNPLLTNSKKNPTVETCYKHTNTRSMLVPFSGYRRRFPEPSRSGVFAEQR